ncbi:universal stress protein [Alicyclobacillus acidocaldarius]|uniref:universal stress protein n=1 Tax=Alicyclobacillus acidocaldarius TaxID=405212 RepID=UPI00345E8030
MKHIVWAVDGSDCAWRAGDMAAECLEKWPEARLTAVFVHVPAVPTSEWTAEYAVQMEREAERLAGELRGEIARRFAAFGPRVAFRVEHGAPAERLVHAADELGADLIVLGSHGKSAVDRLLMGSVSTAVLHRAKQAVLVVR